MITIYLLPRIPKMYGGSAAQIVSLIRWLGKNIVPSLSAEAMQQTLGGLDDRFYNRLQQARFRWNVSRWYVVLNGDVDVRRRYGQLLVQQVTSTQLYAAEICILVIYQYRTLQLHEIQRTLINVSFQVIEIQPMYHWRVLREAAEVYKRDAGGTVLALLRYTKAWDLVQHMHQGRIEILVP